MDKKSGGFTLIELIIVMAMLGILAAIAVPRLAGLRSKAQERVCVANRETVERMYSAFLNENDHENNIFDQFLIENFDEICSANCFISYEDGKVKCSVHGSEGEIEEGEEPGEEVSWL